MRILFCQKNGFPFLVDSDNPPRPEDSKSLEGFTEIAVALAANGFDGIRVSEFKSSDGRFVQIAEV